MFIDELYSGDLFPVKAGAIEKGRRLSAPALFRYALDRIGLLRDLLHQDALLALDLEDVDDARDVTGRIEIVRAGGALVVDLLAGGEELLRFGPLARQA